MTDPDTGLPMKNCCADKEDPTKYYPEGYGMGGGKEAEICCHGDWIDVVFMFGKKKK